VILILLSLSAGLALLYGGAEASVRGATRLALNLGITPLVVSLTVVAFGTSSPELTVSLSGALAGSGDIAVGNVVGSNICNVALILGLAALIRPIEIESRLVRFDVPFAAGCSVLALLFLVDGHIGRIEGGLLVLGVVLYVILCIRLSKAERLRVKNTFRENLPQAPRMLTAVGVVLVGLAALIWGSLLFVDGAVALARRLGASEAAIGLTLVAAGTSLPELATTVVAAARHASDIVLGNIVGSNIFNLTAILGITALVSNLTSEIARADLAVMALLALLLLPFARSGFQLTRLEGGVLLALYIGYVSCMAI